MESVVQRPEVAAAAGMHRSRVGRLAVPKPPVPGSVDASSYTFFAGATRIAKTAAPPMKNRSWRLTARVETDGAKTHGVIMGFGGVAAGMTFHLQEGVPVFDYNFFEKHTIVRGSGPVPEGAAELRVVFDYAGGGPGKGGKFTLKVDGATVGEGEIERTVPGRFGIDSFGIGEDSGHPVTFDCRPPFAFTGAIEQVTIELR
jgi:arylsulfatase